MPHFGISASRWNRKALVRREKGGRRAIAMDRWPVQLAILGTLVASLHAAVDFRHISYEGKDRIVAYRSLFEDCRIDVYAIRCARCTWLLARRARTRQNWRFHERKREREREGEIPLLSRTIRENCEYILRLDTDEQLFHTRYRAERNVSRGAVKFHFRVDNNIDNWTGECLCKFKETQTVFTFTVLKETKRSKERA